MPSPRDASRPFRCTLQFEAQARRRGFGRVAGCDEVGRGALVGPLYAAAVILDPARPIRGVDDSKKLAPQVRAELDAAIRERALAFQVVSVTAADVDRLNVYHASRRAMLAALAALDPPPDFVLADAMRLHGWPDGFACPVPYRSIVHGDARSASVAAASILAKVARDAHLAELDRRYPQYELARNKGYSTADHLAGLARYGPCPEHRRTFQPVVESLSALLPFPAND